ncbi:hypothetical protein ACFPUW_12705 [Thalassorhabdus alkalitolerans]
MSKEGRKILREGNYDLLYIFNEADSLTVNLLLFYGLATFYFWLYTEAFSFPPVKKGKKKAVGKVRYVEENRHVIVIRLEKGARLV